MFIRHVILSTCAALAAAATVHAETVTSTGSGLLTAFPGFGYEYTATWDSSAGSFLFGLTASSSNTGNFSRSIVLNGTFTTTTPQLDVASFDFAGSVDLRIFNTATGLAEIPFTGSGSYLSRTAASYAAISPAGEFRFSNPVLTTTSALSGLANPASPTPRYTTATHFVPGRFAIAASDPNCASVACMEIGRDKLQITNPGSFAYTVQIVPEPATGGLMLLGIAGLVVYATQRRKNQV